MGCINAQYSRAKQKLAMDAHLVSAAPYPHPTSYIQGPGEA